MSHKKYSISQCWSNQSREVEWRYKSSPTCSIAFDLMRADYLDDVKRYPLMPPKVERATEMGMMTENIPRSFSPNVCKPKVALTTIWPRQTWNTIIKPQHVGGTWMKRWLNAWRHCIWTDELLQWMITNNKGTPQMYDYAVSRRPLKGDHSRTLCSATWWSCGYSPRPQRWRKAAPQVTWRRSRRCWWGCKHR